MVTTASPVERFRLGADFERILRLLAEQLYPEPEVFVRELVQNAHDAIRRAQHEDSTVSGRIDITIDPRQGRVVFRDDGVGMDLSDIRTFLSVIGSTGTGAARERLGGANPPLARTLIGQFGVGALAGLTVADRVEVRTRRRGTTEGWLWENDGTPECAVRGIPWETPGTEVTLHIAARHAYVLDADWIFKAVKRHCDLIELPIHVNGRGPINLMRAPWDIADESPAATVHARYATFLHYRTGERPMDVLPVAIDSPITVRGAIGIRSSNFLDGTGEGAVDLHVRRMLVRQGMDNVLPAWASFIMGVIDCPDLDVTAARDNVQREQEAWTTLRNLLRDAIVNWLSGMIRGDRQRFQAIAMRHEAALRRLAAADTVFFELVRDDLLFETNRGPRTLPQCISSPAGQTKPCIYYLAAGEDERQLYPLADARGITVVNTRQPVVEELLVRYAASALDAPMLVRLDSASEMMLLGAPAARPHIVTRFEQTVQRVVREVTRRPVNVTLRRFEPAEVPSLLLASPAASAEVLLRSAVGRDWLSQPLSDLTREALARELSHGGVRLILNEGHPLVARLLGESRHWHTHEDVFCGLHLAACLRARSLLSAEVVEPLHPALVRCLARLLDDERLADVGESLGEVRHAAVH